MTEPTRRIPQWGLPAVLGAFAAWFFGGLFASAGAVAIGGTDAVSEPLGVVAVLVVQSTVGLLALAVLSFTRGQASFARDFGFRAQLQDLVWLPVGIAIQLVGIAVTYPIVELSGRADTEQQLVTTIQQAPLASRLLLIVGVVVLIPVVEELMFRGALLRALLRHLGPPIAVLLNAGLFALVHLLDPNALFGLPALVAVGIATAWLAARTGRIGPAIALHAGFNFVAVLLMFLT